MKKFEHFKSNLRVLALAEKENLSNEFIIGGIIDKFFIQFELGWKVLKELLSDEDIWLGMLKSRNDMTHIYDALAARRLVDMILKQYIPEFQKMEKGIELFYKDEIDNM